MRVEIERIVDDYDRGRLTRRGLIALIAGLASAPRSGAAPGEPTFQATGLDHIALSVSDVARSREFYERHLGLETTRGGSASSFLRCGPQFLALFRSADPGLAHYCYGVAGYAPGDAVERLEAVGLAPRRVSGRVYFDDPDGIEVQVSAGNG
jgi:hypothetical protein